MFGKNGASHVFAPQKGALPEDIEKMDMWMEVFSDTVRKSYPGAEVLLKRTGMEEEISKADLIITGEGRIDEQTCMGKVPVRIAEIAKKYGRPVIAIAGFLQVLKN